MNKSELTKLASDVAHDVLKIKVDYINNQVSSAIKDVSTNGIVSNSDAIVALTSLCMTMTPELSAAVTAEMLVRLGLVTVEDSA